MSHRSEHVLIAPNAEVAAFLREHPGESYLVGTGQLGREHSVLRQTAHRIRRGLMKDFPANADGRYESSLTARKNRKDAVAPVEMTAWFVPAIPDACPEGGSAEA